MLNTLYNRNQSNCKYVRLLNAQVKIHQILVIFEKTSQFFLKFCITLQGHETQLLYTFLAETLYTFNKGACQSTNLVKFYLNNRKTEILLFDGLLLFKSWTVSVKKVQKSYLS